MEAAQPAGCPVSRDGKIAFVHETNEAIKRGATFAGKTARFGDLCPQPVEIERLRTGLWESDFLESRLPQNGQGKQHGNPGEHFT
jgi:hypothetical protein